MDVANEAVENLVTQFSSALDFYRELVQNSIDAGSAAIDIWLDFIPNEDGSVGGVIEIHVDDAGEGMSEAIIDEQLTTLFSSSKEDDLTKIGKFGIGFVSVFALRPRAVLVQTGRDGEYWEVLFSHDRSFYKAPIETPVEGTQITLFVEGDRARYTELVARSLETIDHWCRHSEAEINFEDRASLDAEPVHVNRPFAVEGECPTSFERDGTHIVLAYSPAPSWGFFNKGLALAVVQGETDLVPPELSHIAFRIKSRYLEHTLSRETVMRDENYDKAMAMVVEAAHGPLREALIEAIAALVEAATGGSGRRLLGAERRRYFELMAYLAREGGEALMAFAERPLFLGLDGLAYSLVQITEGSAADGRVYVASELDALTEQVLAQGSPVLMIPSHSETSPGAQELDPVARVLANGLAQDFIISETVDGLLHKLRGDDSSPWARAAALIARPADVLVGVELVNDVPAATALVSQAWSILERGLGPAPGLVSRALRSLRRKDAKLSYAKLVCARLTSHGPSRPEASVPLFVIAHAIAPLMATPTKNLDTRKRRARPARPEAAVNCEHPHFRALLQLSSSQPALAAYALAKALLLDEDRGLELDTALIQAALDPTFVNLEAR